MMKKEEEEQEVCVRVKEGKTCQGLTPVPAGRAHSVRDLWWTGHSHANRNRFQSGAIAHKTAMNVHVRGLV